MECVIIVFFFQEKKNCLCLFYIIQIKIHNALIYLFIIRNEISRHQKNVMCIHLFFLTRVSVAKTQTCRYYYFLPTQKTQNKNETKFKFRSFFFLNLNGVTTKEWVSHHTFCYLIYVLIDTKTKFMISLNIKVLNIYNFPNRYIHSAQQCLPSNFNLFFVDKILKNYVLFFCL